MLELVRFDGVVIDVAATTQTDHITCESGGGMKVVECGMIRIYRFTRKQAAWCISNKHKHNLQAIGLMFNGSYRTHF